jgi:hypothetical protein
MCETEAAVTRAMQIFEGKASRGDLLKVADCTRLLEGLGETFVEPPARMTLRWADKWQQTTSTER